MIAAVVVAALAGILLGLGAGVALERRARHRLAVEAGRAALDELATRQAADDRRTLSGARPLPPMVTRAEALERADRDGTSVAEAAGAIFAARAAALVTDNVRRNRR